MLGRIMFQLTAARRRLERLTVINGVVYGVCFNSQPPEGGWRTIRIQSGVNACFNSQPPEGGWRAGVVVGIGHVVFQLTAARRRLAVGALLFESFAGFNSQPPEGGWA